MRRRTRAIVFAALALVAAVVGASLIAGYGSRVAGGYGPLRPVVVRARADRRAALPGWRSLTVRATCG